MTLARLSTRTLIVALASLTAPVQTQAQTPTQPQPQSHTAPPAPSVQAPTATAVPKKPRPKAATLNPGIILLDPAHGGTDTGAKLGEDSLEKETTIAFAGRLKTTLVARGFTVVLTHDSADDQLASDARAELANRSHASACLILHASNGGHGVHLFTSSLAASTAVPETPDEFKPIQPWDTAQAAAIPQSQRLAKDLSDALYGIRVPLVVARASIRPMDAMTCPVVALELSPLPGDSGATPASDGAYQQRVVDAVASALAAWRARLVAATAASDAAKPVPPKPPTTPPVPPVRKPKPIAIPVETPDINSVPAPKTAPSPAPRPAPAAPTPPKPEPPQ